MSWPDRIHAIDPDKRIVMSELWLSKVGAGETVKPNLDLHVVARDIYRFWGPLDQKFLRVVGATARAKGFELVAPSRSLYFFSYVDYNDPLTFRLRPRGLLDLASQRAYEAILRGDLTHTGLTFRYM